MGVDYYQCVHCSGIYNDCGSTRWREAFEDGMVCGDCYEAYTKKSEAVPQEMEDPCGPTVCHLRLAGGTCATVAVTALPKWAEENAPLLDAPIFHAFAKQGEAVGEGAWKSAHTFSEIALGWHTKTKGWGEEEDSAFFFLPNPPHRAARDATELVERLTKRLASAIAMRDAAVKAAAACPLVINNAKASVGQHAAPAESKAAVSQPEAKLAAAASCRASCEHAAPVEFKAAVAPPEPKLVAADGSERSRASAAGAEPLVASHIRAREDEDGELASKRQKTSGTE